MKPNTQLHPSYFGNADPGDEPTARVCVCGGWGEGLYGGNARIARAVGDGKEKFREREKLALPFLLFLPSLRPVFLNNLLKYPYISNRQLLLKRQIIH